MPAWLKLFGLAFPSTFFFSNFRMLLSSGMPLHYLASSIAILLSLTALYGLATILALKRML